MRVESSAVALRAAHQETRQVRVEERLEFRPPLLNTRPTASSAPQPDSVSVLDYKAAIALWLYEYFTGEKSSLLRSASSSTPVPAGAPPANASWGVSYTRTEITHEAESTTFAAEGTVRLASGKTVDFELHLQMDRKQTTVNSVSFRAGNMSDPIAVNFDGLGARLTSERRAFDLNGDGINELIASLAEGSAWLARDTNGNGQVDNGMDLFGPRTGNGFAELAALDEDGNGWIDGGDAAFAQMGLWRGGDFVSLGAAGIGALSTANVATPLAHKAGVELLGQTRSSGVYLNENGTPGVLQQLDLSV